MALELAVLARLIGTVRCDVMDISLFVVLAAVALAEMVGGILRCVDISEAEATVCGMRVKELEKLMGSLRHRRIWVACVVWIASPDP